MMVMVSATPLADAVCGLGDCLSLSLYALVALCSREDGNRGTEAAMKYFVLGALASGLLLYGMSLLYGATGSLDIAVIAKALAGGTANQTLALFGLVFIVAGLAFKLGAVPFHMWVPDVYHGAPTAITLLIGGAPKLAAFVFVVRILMHRAWQQLWRLDWQGMLVILAGDCLAGTG
jgi:NADH-quinone oxidoreductase subunit N